METQQGPVEATQRPAFSSETVDLTGVSGIDNPFVAPPVEDLLRQVTDVFPDICPVHLDKLAVAKFHVPESIIDAILQDLENGVPYPKRSALGKRKRQADPIVESLAKSDEEFGENDVKRLNEYFIGPSWKEQVAKIKSYRQLCVDYLVSRVFRSAPKSVVRSIFDQQRDASLFQVYWMMGQHGYGEETAGWDRPDQNWKPEFDSPGADPAPDGDPVNLCKELYAARRIAAFNGRGVLEERNEAANRARAEADGTLRDCGCCFSDEPINRMVGCDANPEHLFCYACARKYAETQLGLSKYELKCLSMDDCPGDFYPAERKSYLDSKTIAALDRHEQDAALREANIENLASCPFCPYAAVCPPVEEDKEFRCMNPECRAVSCRLCNRETHVPKTCAEAVADNKSSALHQIEEAMSEAIIRKCNKCSTPFVKLSGCNKMTCSKPSCRNQQCYICGKSCDYNHFSKTGCPLHDNTWDAIEVLHRKEAETAQETARKRLLEENPDMTEEELNIKLPDIPAAVKNKKKAANPRPQAHRGARANAPPLPQVYPVAYMAAPLQPWGPLYPHGQNELQYAQWNQQVGPAQLYQLPQSWPQQQGQPPQAPQAGQQLGGIYQHPFIPMHLLNQVQPPVGQRAQAPVQQLGLRYPPQTPEEHRAWEQKWMRDALAAMNAPEALGRTQAPPATNPPGAAAPGQHYSANGAALPGGGTAPLSPVGELMKSTVNEMRQAQSKYSLEIRLALLNALKPYVNEIGKQVGNHIQAAWVGVMPPQVAEAIVRPIILREAWNGVPKLVDGELEEIDRTVKDTNWEKLYSTTAVGQGQLRHVGEIPPPDSADEYVAMHAIIRSCDRQAPPHHAEMARRAHATVMVSLGQQQPPPRVAPYHHHGNPDYQALQVWRIQKYLSTRWARVSKDRGVNTTGTVQGGGNAAGAINGTAGGSGKPILIPVPEIEGPAAGLRSAQTGTPAAGAGTGSRDTPILIDNAEPGNDVKNETAARGGTLPYRVVKGERPAKSGRV